MVFGIRVSYHRSRFASTSNIPQDSICPCSKCFDQIREPDAPRARESPAQEWTRPRGYQGSTCVGRSRDRLGFGLRRWRSVDTMASDMRPLRDSVRKTSTESIDGQSVEEERL